MNIPKVSLLIQEGAERDIVDFKEQFSGYGLSLMHDIICMANNTEFENAYLVFGIDDNGAIVGTENQEKRINSNDLQDFLQNNKSKFFNEEVPEVEFTSMRYHDHELDIIEIKCTHKQPYFLIKNFSAEGGRFLRSGHYYTRTGDRNTAIDQMASPNIVEKLWRRRFRLDEKPIDKLWFYLDFPEKWLRDNSEKQELYNLFYEEDPQFKILVSVSDETEDSEHFEFFSFGQIHKSTYLGSYKCLVQGSCIDYGVVFHLNSMRTIVTEPETEWFGSLQNPTLEVHYFIMNTIKYKLLNLLNRDPIPGINLGLHRFLKCILVFIDENERDQFFNYISENLDSIRTKVDNQVKGDDLFKGQTVENNYVLTTGCILNEMLNEFRNELL